ncbi:gp34 [Rhodococcus phage ReqiPine5]|uniref:Gp34 n=1 Tax=Rhodococcus phage ReqiPine5 TaxID=691963 RepID=D4P809_9CAUD|nr:gp34 [Rhodococcus phage ReqiPine5]ADD81139.1 gp34 [Rhodococcus phage ReqiPine5]
MATTPPGDTDLERECEAILSKSVYYDIEFGPHILKARVPSPAALRAFTCALSNKVSTKVRTDHMSRFIQQHLAPESLDVYLETAMDPDAGLDKDAMFRVYKKIATSGTARPFGPSR